jgi:hypothetical protein
MLGKHRLLLPRAKGTPAFLQATMGSFGFSAGQREGLFAPDRLAGGRDSGNLSNMQRVRGCKKDRLNARIGNGVLEFGRQFEAFGGGEIADQFRLLAHAADKAQALAFALNRIDDIFPPASETDYGGIDHE